MGPLLPQVPLDELEDPVQVLIALEHRVVVDRAVEEIQLEALGVDSGLDGLSQLYRLLERDEVIRPAMLDQDGRHVLADVRRGIRKTHSFRYLTDGSP